jgi:hypothetical protein
VPAEPEVGHHALEVLPPLALAHEQEPDLGQRGEEPLEAGEQQLVAPVGRQPRHRDRHRPLPERELRPDRATVRGRREPRQIGHARHPEHAARGEADLAAPRLDRPRDGQGRGGAPVEARGHCRPAHGPEIVERPHHRGPAPLAAAGAGEQGEPVVVRVVRVHDLDARLAHERAQPQHVADEVEGREPRLEPDSLDDVQAGLPRLRLEPVAGDHGEQDPVTTRPQAGDETDRRIRAPRPPPVRDDVQHRDGRVAHAARASSDSTCARTPWGSIPARHGCSIGQTR